MDSTHSSVQHQHPILPQEFKRKIKEICGENEIGMIIQKKLFKTDVSKNNNRLSVPFGKITSFNFLKENEKRLLDMQHYIDVTVIHKQTKNNEIHDLKESTVTFRQWDMPKESSKKSSMYVLRGKWNEIVKENELEINDEIQIWASRKANEENKLCLILVVVSKNKLHKRNMLCVNNVRGFKYTTSPLGLTWGRTQKRTMRYEVFV
ncbi:hypothetical protein VNO77_35317 [Canavalia gladiata]|uniref:TF-B3 domain-containing protein n=1 Tax=Canavalia gladiata TaxID=3824 RepID=A0AAN9KHH9_CANGL